MVLSEPESEGGAELRRSRGASGSRDPEELLFPEDEDEDEEGDEDPLPEPPGAISARGPLSSAPETARRTLGVLLLLEEDELPDDALDELFELFERPESSELDAARRRRGRSGSLSSDEADERLAELLVSSEDEARRNTGLFEEPLPEDVEADEVEPDEEEPDDDDPLSGRGNGAVSSVCRDASECSSLVPTWIIEIDDAL